MKYCLKFINNDCILIGYNFSSKVGAIVKETIGEECNSRMYDAFREIVENVLRTYIIEKDFGTYSKF